MWEGGLQRAGGSPAKLNGFVRLAVLFSRFPEVMKRSPRSFAKEKRWESGKKNQDGGVLSLSLALTSSPLLTRARFPVMLAQALSTCS